ncbi:MAG: FecR domain-containing protein [Planctomycetaceae bacterium]|nr:FecR domain-containing protein [Planctomycetaceae bacterium]
MLALLAALLIGAPAADAGSPAGPAKLAIAQGSVEGPAMPLKVGDDVEAGAPIKTAAGVRATFDFPDGSELRVNENTELSIDGPRKVTLKQGHVFAKIGKGAGVFEVATPQMKALSNQGLLDVEFIPRVPNGAPAQTFFRVLDGTAKCSGPKFTANVFPGFYATGIGSQLNTPDPLGNGSLTTAWMHPLLVERGRIDEETGNRAMELVQILGREAANDPGEAALRTLGDLATAELVRMVSKSAGPAQAARRNTAVKIVAETGTLKSAAGLVSLLQHSEPEVRVVAARGLARIAGKDLGFDDAFWKGEALEKGQKAWDDWVKQNAK